MKQGSDTSKSSRRDVLKWSGAAANAFDSPNGLDRVSTDGCVDPLGGNDPVVARPRPAQEKASNEDTGTRQSTTCSRAYHLTR
jgi:hypothetical protein